MQRPLTSPSASPVRAVVCDDSSFMRRFLSDALRRGGIEVVGEAASGQQALDVCAERTPDVLTLDLEMPGLGGLDVLRRLPPSGPQVVVVSAHTNEGSALALDALADGAVEVVRKPELTTPAGAFAADLAQIVRGVAGARRPFLPVRAAAAPGPPGPARDARPQRDTLVVIASSTGGPRALTTLVPRLPDRLGCGGVIVQHMPPGFTATLARRLDAASALTVREACDGDAIAPDTLLVAPGDHHLRVERGRVRLGDGPPVGGLRPRADVTLSDAAQHYGANVLAIVLTGMGSDGLAGVRAVKAAGGRCVAEAEQSCVVYGMPRAVAEAGLTDEVHPLDGLAAAVGRGVRR